MGVVLQPRDLSASVSLVWRRGTTPTLSRASLDVLDVGQALPSSRDRGTEHVLEHHVATFNIADRLSLDMATCRTRTSWHGRGMLWGHRTKDGRLC